MILAKQLPVVLLTVIECMYASSLPLRILILTSSYNVTTVQSVPQWARGEELIPGALLAADEVNARDDILTGVELEPVVLLVPNCSVSEGIHKTISEMLTSRSRPVGIIGLLCNKLARAIVPLISRKKLSLIQLSGAMALREDKYPNFYRFLPHVEYHIRAVLDLMQALNWTRIGLLNSVAGLDNFYVKAAEAFVRQVQTSRRVEILLHAEVGDRGRHDTTIDSIVQTIELSQVRITVAFLSPYQSFDLICQAHLRGLSWPRNAWILFDVSLHDTVTTTECDVDTLLEAMENVFIIQSNVQPEDLNSILISGKTYSSYTQSLRAYIDKTILNPFTNVLYDATWGLSLSINSSLPALQQMNIDLNHQGLDSLNSNVSATIGTNLGSTSFMGASGRFHFSNSTTRQLERRSYVSHKCRMDCSYQLGHLTQAISHQTSI